MTKTVEYCLRNVDSEARRRLLAAAEAESDGDADDVEVIEQRCLQRCGDCYHDDFLVVDGALAVGDSHAALLSATLGEER